MHCLNCYTAHRQVSIRSGPIKPVFDWQVVKLQAHAAFTCLHNCEACTSQTCVLAYAESGCNYLSSYGITTVNASLDKR